MGEQGKLLLRIECQPRNAERIVTFLNKSPFENYHSHHCSGECHQWILKLLGESVTGTEYLYSLEVNPQPR